MKRIFSFCRKYSHALPLLLYGIVYLTWFYLLEQKVTKHYTVIHMDIDNHIPFCEIFVIPYFMWFAYIAVVVCYFLFKDKDDYYRMCIFLGAGMTVFLLVSTFWPNGHHLRLAVMPRENIFTKLVEYLWSIDTATNLWPSIHVYNSIGVHLAIAKSKHFAARRGIRIASLVLCTAIILSTVFLKQHSVFDVITAFMMAGGMYVLVYRKDVYVTMKQRMRAKTKHRKRPQIG